MRCANLEPYQNLGELSANPTLCLIIMSCVPTAAQPCNFTCCSLGPFTNERVAYGRPQLGFGTEVILMIVFFAVLLLGPPLFLFLLLLPGLSLALHLPILVQSVSHFVLLLCFLFLLNLLLLSLPCSSLLLSLF